MRAQRFNACLLLIVGFLDNFPQRVVHCETYKQFLARTLPEICPYSTFCTYGPFKPFKYKQYSPCCKPCSCDNDCMITGSCCPDYPGVVSANRPIQPISKCSSPVHYSYTNITTTAIPGLKYEHTSYHVIYTCPVEYTSAEIIRKCVHANSEVLPRDFVVVSDGRGYAFFNRFCAICNGVTTFTLWNLLLVCVSRDYTVTDVSNHQQLSDGECILLSSPPTPTIGWQSHCLPPKYSECNVTGRWTNSDSNIQRACESTLYPYYNELAPTTIVHKNPFCYICNDARGTFDRLQKLCHPETKVTLKGTHSNAFIGMIDVNAEPLVNNNARCLSSEVFDHHFARCRLLNCPLTSTPKNGECVQIFRGAYGLSIYMQIEVQFAYDNREDIYTYLLNSKPETLADFENITLALLDDIGMRKHGCNSCPTVWLQRKDKTGVTLLVGYRTNGSCTAAAIFDTVNTWRQGLDKSSAFFAMKNATRLMFYKALAYDIQRRNTGTSAHKSKKFTINPPKFTFCSSQVFLRPMFYCAFVDISRNEHTDLYSRNISTVKLSDFIAVKVKSKTVYRICLGNYLRNYSTNAMACLFEGVERVAMTFVAMFAIITSKLCV